MMTVVQRVVAPLGLLLVLGLGATNSVASFEPTKNPRVARARLVPPPDTITTTAEPHAPLILSLPSSVGTRNVERYTLISGPALCGVAGRSFAWIPEDAEPGWYQATLEAHAANAPADTLVVRIELGR